MSETATLTTLANPVSGPDVWTGAEMATRDDWLYRLGAEDIDEIAAATADYVAAGHDLMAMTRDRFPLPKFGPRLQAMREEILRGRGFVQTRGLPIRDYGRREAAVAFLGIAAHLGDRLASQNDKGHVLGHVADIGQTRTNPDQRGPYSAESLPFHADACDMVGLLCLSPARSGGESSIASAGAVFNALVAQRPDLVAPLMQPIYRDRRGEVPPGKPPWYAIPIFNLHAGLLTTSIEPSYIASIGRHFAVNPHTPAQLEGIELVQQLADTLRLDIDFEPGDMQFLHNHSMMHARRAFIDDDGADRRRHLMRVWLLCDDGRPLPDAFYNRHGSRATIRRPGGIVGPDTVLNCPLEPV